MRNIKIMNWKHLIVFLFSNLTSDKAKVMFIFVKHVYAHHLKSSIVLQSVSGNTAVPTFPVFHLPEVPLSTLLVDAISSLYLPLPDSLQFRKQMKS